MPRDRVVLRPDWWRAAEAVRALPADPFETSQAHVQVLPGLSADVVEAGPDLWGRVHLAWSRPARVHALAHRVRTQGLRTATPLGYARVGGHGWLLRATRTGQPCSRWGRPEPSRLQALADLIARTHRSGLWHPRPARGIWWNHGPCLEELPRWRFRQVPPQAWLEHVLSDLDLTLRDGIRLARLAVRHRWDPDLYRPAVRGWRASLLVDSGNGSDVP